jgi:hypothetical protein
LIPARKGRLQEISVACGGRIPADDVNMGGNTTAATFGPDFARKLASIIAEIMGQGVTLNVRGGATARGGLWKGVQVAAIRARIG